MWDTIKYVPVTRLFEENSERLITVNYFRKKNSTIGVKTQLLLQWHAIFAL